MAFSHMCLVYMLSKSLFKEVNHNTDHPDKRHVKILEAFSIFRVS